MNTQSTSRVLTGLLIMAVGGAFLLNSVGIASVSNLFATWWPLFVIAIGVINLIGTPRLFIWRLFIIAAGVALQLRALDILQFEPWSVLWPLGIIAIGLSFIFRPALPSAKSSDDDHTNAMVAFSGHKVRNVSRNYQGGQMAAWFGGIEVDLRGADIKDRAKLDVVTAFGGVEIRVPEGWTVVTNGLPIFGGWENKTTSTNKSGPVLEITGTCVFGGIEIKN